MLLAAGVGQFQRFVRLFSILRVYGGLLS